MAEQRVDRWTSGAAYERYMGRWSRIVAREFLAWLDRADGLRWLDVGCGTGALSSAVTERCGPRGVVGCDRSEEFVSAAAARAPAPDSPRFVVADALALPVRDGAFDVAVSALTLNFLPEPALAVRELSRAVRPGGLVAAYVWDYGAGMGLLRHFWAAATATDPAAAALDEGHRFPRCRPEPLHSLWTDAGLTAVSTTPIDVPTHFTDFADLWAPFLSGQGPAPGYVASLTPPDRDRLRDTLRTRVPTAPDGSIRLTARAWGVRGIKA
ncbi:class I SAM-dependent methyltransferase [Streptomyces sp. HD]|uniref:class I SAM-dependent methyltransferase n=1 Tax=Streptomyces sp. HD TaxID=3020892 RepID=UPI00232AB75F|nr:class I SAM-dependent methyltransferase [Streptomyces sp. HD]MDC0770509.1 class I SAM-dependent methyltransferase [Streptomyces sp. HD]